MQKKIRNSLTIKIFCITSLLLILVCGLTYKFIAYVTPISYQSILNSDIEEQMQELTDILSNTTLEKGKELIKKFSIQINNTVILTREDGIEIKFPEENLKKEGEIIEDIIVTQALDSEKTDNYQTYKIGTKTDSMTTREKMGMSIGTNFHFIDSPKEYFLIINIGVTEVNEVTKALGKIFPWLCILIFIISLLGSYIYSVYITKPIVQISKIAKKMAKLEFNYECEEKRKDEIGVLGQSLNQLSKKLSITLMNLQTANIALTKEIENEKQAEKIRQEFFSAASHELKTPLTIIKGQIEGMIYKVGVYKDRDTYLKRVREAVEDMEHLVKQILIISKMQTTADFTKKEEIFLKKEEIILKELLERQRRQYLELMEKKQLSFQISIEENLQINGNRTLLEYVFSNLYSNAVFYSPPHEEIKIMAERQEDKVFFSIENTGITIPEEHLDKLTTAFYREEMSRNRETGGSGLGLYIVKMILEEEKAEFKIRNTENGVCIEIFFTENTNKAQETSKKIC